MAVLFTSYCYHYYYYHYYLFFNLSFFHWAIRKDAMTIDTSELTIDYHVLTYYTLTLTYHILIKSRSLHNSTKKGFMICFYRDVMVFHEVPFTPCFPSRDITKNAEIYPPPMRDLIIEQPQWLILAM